jgi:ribonuclease HI
VAHPAKAIELKNKRDDMHYKLEIYTDGSKHENGVGSGLAIFVDGSLTHQLRYKVAEKWSNNQEEQLAIVKALTKLRSIHTIQGRQRTTAIQIDSPVTLEAIDNPKKLGRIHQEADMNIRRRWMDVLMGEGTR